MTFLFEKERIRAIRDDGMPVGHIVFPRVRPGLVNISHVVTEPEFRGQGVAERMMEALLPHLMQQGMKAALTNSFAQKYVSDHPEWKHILPGEIHFTRH